MFMKENGSFTLVWGVLNDEPIFAGVAASTVSGALEGFVRATAIELPKGLRINLVNPTILEESVPSMGSFFHGVIPVEGWRVGQAYKRAILGAPTGRVSKVDSANTRFPSPLPQAFSPTPRRIPSQAFPH